MQFLIIITLSQMTEKGSKTKIIYTTLENLVKSSSLSKAKTQEKENSLPKHASVQLGNITSKSNLKQSISRHVLQSKENLSSKISEKSKSREKPQPSSQSLQLKGKVLPPKKYFEQIQKIYIDLELALHHSKRQFLKKMNTSTQNEAKINEDFKRLLEKSSQIKMLLAQTTQYEVQQQNYTNQSLQKTISSNEVDNIAYLSKANRKNLNEKRLKKRISNKKLTLYEEILKRKH